ncbi:MAG: ABC transporter substrate-binding protein [Bacteroidaceae bacterium]|nr:ABC transporter substrate-binding protein [Bacteroidaceae bacterium]
MKKRIFLGFLSCMVCMISQAQDRLIFTPQWTAQAQFAGYYVAQEMGFFYKAGIEVDIVHPSVTQSAISRIQNNESQATTLQLTQAMEIINDGIPLVNILQTSMNNAMVIVSRRNMNPLEQYGAKVGIWNAGFGQVAICMAIKENLNYHWIPFANSVNLFISGAIDATLGMSYNEYYQLAQTGIELNDKNVYRFRDHGYNIQEDGVYMTREFYEKNKDLAERFAEACRQGWEWAAQNPEETLDIVMDYVEREHISTNRIHQKLMLDEVLSLLKDRESGQREYRLRPDMVKQASDLMLENGMLEMPVTYEDLIDQ